MLPGKGSRLCCMQHVALSRALGLLIMQTPCHVPLRPRVTLAPAYKTPPSSVVFQLGNDLLFGTSLQSLQAPAHSSGDYIL